MAKSRKRPSDHTRVGLAALSFTLAASVLLTPGSVFAEGFVATPEQVEAAVAATLAQAARTGITYVNGGQTYQRNPDSTIFTSTTDGTRTVYVRDPSGGLRTFTGGRPMDAWPTAIARQYGIAARPLFEVAMLEPEQAQAFANPWSALSSIDGLRLQTDTQGRLVKAEHGGTVLAEVKGFSAPQAVMPRSNELLQMGQLYLIDSLGYAGQTLNERADHAMQSAVLDPRFARDRVGTLRRYLREDGWDFVPTARGARLVQVGATGETWTSVLDTKAPPSRRVRTTVTGLPDLAVAADLARIQGRLELAANVELFGVAASLERAAGLGVISAANAESRLLKHFGGTVEQPGRIIGKSRELVTWSGEGSPWRLRLAVSLDGQCIDTSVNPQAPRLREFTVNTGSAVAGGRCA